MHFAVWFHLAVINGRGAVTAIKQFQNVKEPQSKVHCETAVV